MQGLFVLSSMTLIRIPFVIMASIAFQRAVTPPHSPPTNEENVTPTRLEYILRRPLTGVWVTVIVWYATFAETAVILASHYPDTPTSRWVLSIFILEPGNTRNIRPTTTFFVGIFLTLIGSYIRWTCYRALGRMFTFELSVRKNHRLVTGGPYAIVRHPAYIGLFLMLLGTFLWHGSSGSWTRESGVLQTHGGQFAAFTYLGTVSTVSMALFLRMSKEDLLMKKTFGEEWEEWASRVRYKLVPGVY